MPDLSKEQLEVENYQLACENKELKRSLRELKENIKRAKSRLLNHYCFDTPKYGSTDKAL